MRGFPHSLLGSPREATTEESGERKRACQRDKRFPHEQARIFPRIADRKARWDFSFPVPNGTALQGNSSRSPSGGPPENFSSGRLAIVKK